MFGDHTGEVVRVSTRSARQYEQRAWPIASRADIQELLPGGHLVITTAAYTVHDVLTRKALNAVRHSPIGRELTIEEQAVLAEREDKHVPSTTVVFPPGEWLRFDITPSSD